MNQIDTILDFMSFIAAFIAILFLLWGWRKRMTLDIKLMLLLVMSVTLFYGLYSSLTNDGHREDYIRIILPVIWGFLFYTFLVQHQHKEKETAENALSESELQFRTLFETANDPIFLIKDDKIYSCNKATLELFEYSHPEDVTGKTFWQLSPEFQSSGEKSEDKAKHYLYNARSGINQKFLWQHKKQNGVVFDAEVSINAFIINGKTFVQSVVRDITRRIEEEKAIKELHSRLYAVFNGVDNIPVQGYDKERRVIFWNKASETVYGYSSKEALGKKLEDLIIPETIREEVINLSNAWHEHGIAIPSSDLILKNKNNEPVHVYSSHILIENPKGKKEMFSVDVDINVLKTTENALKLSEKRYKALFEGISDAAFVHFYEPNGANRFFEVNDAACIRLEYSRKELLDLSPEDVTANGSRGIYNDVKIQSEIFNNKFSVFESVQVSKTGKKIPVEISCRIFEIENKRALLCLARDISERKKAETLLERQSQFQKILIEISSDFINLPANKTNATINETLGKIGAFINADRTYVFEYDHINGVANNTFEWCAQGIEAQIDRLQELPMDVVPFWIEANLKGEMVYIADVSELPPGYGKDLLELQNIKSLLSLPLISQEELLGFVGFDFVKRHHYYSKNERQLLQVFAQMLVNIHLRKKMDEELIRAKEKAEESDRLKSNFLANMSHEIRTPMNGILGFSSLLMEPELTGDRQQAYLENIMKSGHRMLNTINDLIEISKIEAGQVALDIETVLPESLIQELYNFYKPMADEKNIKLRKKNTNSISSVSLNTDTKKLYRAMSNLLNNALKFTEKGTVEFGFDVLDHNVHLYVKDTGIGIGKNIRQNIFDRFIQADLKTTKAHEGAGLGLSITKAYVEMLGGYITLESELNKGTIVDIYLPYAPGDNLILKNINTMDPDNTYNIQANWKLLIVEDEHTSVLYLKEVLKKYCREIISAENGEKAIKIAENTKDFDVILMDIKLPGIDGYQATREIRKTNKDIVIIAQTAFAMSGDREKALDAGCDDYITKPTRKEDLIALIQTNLQKKQNNS